MKVLKFLGIWILIFLCVIPIIITWCLWIPYMLTYFPFTGIFMHEHELPMYPYYWIMTLQEKL